MPRPKLTPSDRLTRVVAFILAKKRIVSLQELYASGAIRTRRQLDECVVLSGGRLSIVLMGEKAWVDYD